MKTLVIATIFLFVGLTFLGPLPARADEVLQLSGTILAVGNSAPNCNPKPCAVVVDFTNQVLITDIPPSQQPIFVQGLTNTFDYTVQSSLGNSSGSGQTLEPTLLFTSSAEAIGYFVVPGFPGEVDLNFHVVMTANGFDFQPNGALFFSCSGVCAQDFIIPQSGRDSCFSGLDCSGVTYPVELLGFSAERVPEPSSLELGAYAGSLFGLAFLFTASSRKGGSSPKPNFGGFAT